MEHVHSDITAKLFFYQRCSGVVILLIIWSPPVLEISIGVKLAALIVETVCQLVANDAPYASVVCCVVRPGVKVRRLQNTRRKNYFIEVRVVVSINSGRGYSPLGAINRLADLLEVTLKLKPISLQVIQHVRPGIDCKPRIVAQLLGISDLDGDRVQFSHSLSPCRLTYPMDGLDPV